MLLTSDITDQLHKITKTTISALVTIWENLGLDDETQNLRLQMFSKHVQDLYNDMLQEAESTKETLERHNDSLVIELGNLGFNLGLDLTIPSEDMQIFEAHKKLVYQVEKYRSVYEERSAELKNLIAKQKSICKALGRECRELLSSPLPTEEELNNFKIYLDELSDLKFHREEIFLEKKILITDIMNELKLTPSLDFERKIVLGSELGFQTTDENMEMLEKLHTSLLVQLEETREKINELRETVTTLWELLEESPEVRSQFLNANPGNSVDTLNALKIEVARCQQKKKDNIESFVVKMRQELIYLWDKCHISCKERAEFLHFESTCYTEDLLSLHELQIEKVKMYYEKNKHIFELMEKRDDLWQKLIDLEINQEHKPDRYKNRGGQLLREEKERKIISSKLPKIEKALLETVEKYEAETKNVFLINGTCVNEIIEKSWAEHRENKQLTLSARKHARDNTKLACCKSRVGTPRLQLPRTPALTINKNKLNTPHFNNVERNRINNEKLLRTAPSKLCQVNGSTIRRASLERKRKMERLKGRSQPRKDKENTPTKRISDYNDFKEGISKPNCRSTLFPQHIHVKHAVANNNVHNTPRRVL